MLVEKLSAIDGVKKAFTATHFHETVLQLEQSATGVLKALMEKGILGGFDLSQDYPELGEAILVCTTEMRTEEDIDLYADTMREVLCSGAAVASLAESA
jgi:glycine dehydrogenase subunit 1